MSTVAEAAYGLGAAQCVDAFCDRGEAGQLDVKGVAGVAVVAAVHSDGYAATGHLLGLLAALPAPTAAGEHFWSALWKSSGTAYLLPVNIKDPVLRSLAGEGTALARQILSGLTDHLAGRGALGRRVRPSARPQDTGHRRTVAPRSRTHRLARPARRPQVGRSGWTESLPRRLDERLNVGSPHLHGTAPDTRLPCPTTLAATEGRKFQAVVAAARGLHTSGAAQPWLRGP
ncbi:hypothetical protein ACIQUP_02265 [Streptomyces nigra]|uniref:hypothetical protein n=1 Tax=Streptomyces nigra TaxID=1827580 RepID=UPI0037FFC45F